MNRIFFCALLPFLLQQCQSQSPTQGSSEHAYTNALINESSPYLLQHAHNPVDWYPWGDEALKKAEESNKLLIISVGYAACHWCHVMEHESFEDTAVSRLMNENFVSIKVDREERPDVDDVYMTACQMASGRGCGWPLNAIALPDGRPVWAGTYFPKDEWVKILDYFVDLKGKDMDKMIEYAAQLAEGIQSAGAIEPISEIRPFTEDQLSEIGTAFLSNIDMKNGGRNGAPKFPMPNNYRFLMQYAFESGSEDAGNAVRNTLDRMGDGGIYDQVGGGFARYSTDGEWHIPHFEKMLYDNSQLISLYADAYRWTGKERYKEIIRETIEFANRELYDSESGAYYSSLDADSEGEEGKFYVWSKTEVDSILGEGDHGAFLDFFDITKNGNWEHGKNALRRVKTFEQIQAKYELDLVEFQKRIDNGTALLMKARDSRIRPALDDKILTAWNALMIKGLVDAYNAVGDDSYLTSALKVGNFIANKVKGSDHRLTRNYKDGKASINAFLDDYALTIEAFIALYETTFDEKWLYTARDLAEYVRIHFSDEKSGMFFYASDIDPPLIARKMELGDNVIPGSNSMMANVLHTLGLYFYNTEYLDLSTQMLTNIMPQINEAGQPNFYSNWCRLLINKVNPRYEVAVVGQDYQRVLEDLLSSYQPNKILMGGKSEGTLDLLKDKLQEDQTLIYVCQNKVCKFPVSEVEEAIKLME